MNESDNLNFDPKAPDDSQGNHQGNPQVALQAVGIEPGTIDEGAGTGSAAVPAAPTDIANLHTQGDPDGGIEILVKLAASGEIDPKNMDIIDVTDKFLRAIAAAPKENLRQSGKILFHASVLLRMKAEALLAAANAELENAGDDFLDFEEDGTLIYDSHNQPVARQITLADLEKALVRRTNNRSTRQRKVTLEQLIDALREAERIEKTRKPREPRACIDLSGHHEVNDVDDILDLAHDEDIETTISRVEQLLIKHLETGGMMELLNLIRLLDGHGDWVDAFLAILFLSNAGKITLEQQDFYGPLYLVRSDEESASVA